VGPGTICIVSIQKEIHTPLFESRLTGIRNRVNKFRNQGNGENNNEQED
jgi:hypothetical protein